jgi:hypothetical protein
MSFACTCYGFGHMGTAIEVQQQQLQVMLLLITAVPPPPGVCAL